MENEALQQQVADLRTQIKSLEYLIRMDGIDPLDQNNHLVASRMQLEAEVDTLLTLVRHYNETLREQCVSAETDPAAVSEVMSEEARKESV